MKKCNFCAEKCQNEFTSICDRCWELTLKIRSWLLSPAVQSIVLEELVTLIRKDPAAVVIRDDCLESLNILYERLMNGRLYTIARELAKAKGLLRPQILIVPPSTIEEGFLYSDDQVEIRVSRKDQAQTIFSHRVLGIHDHPAIAWNAEGHICELNPHLLQAVRPHILEINQSR